MGKEMRYLETRAKNTLLVVLITLVGLFLFTQGTGKMFTSLQPIQGQQQNVVTACIDNSCQTIVCVDDQLCHSFRPNNDPAANEQPLDDTTTAMQPIEENNADAVQPSKDNMEIMTLMEKDIVH
jgi:hypothetical protein